MSFRRHIGLNLAGHTLPLATSLFTVPTILRLYGDQLYGELVLGLLLATYAGLAELGLSQAVARRMAYLPITATAERQATLSTGFWSSGALGLAGGLIAWFLGYIYFSSRVEERSAASEFAYALAWLIPLVPICSMGAVLTAALQAQSRFAELNLVQGLGGVALQMAPLMAAVSVGASLPAAFCAIVAVRSAMLLVLWSLQGEGSYTSESCIIDRVQLRNLLRYGRWATVSAAVGSLMVVLDRFVIGHHLGIKTVPVYAIPIQLTEKMTLLSAALSHALFPKLVAASSQEQRSVLVILALRLVALVTAPFVAVGIIFCGPFLAWWLPNEISADGTLIAKWLLVGFWLNGLALVPLTSLYAAGRSAVVAKCHLIELPPYFLLLIWSVIQAGVVGAAAAFAVRALTDLLLLAGAASILARTAFTAALSGLVVVVAVIAISLPDDLAGVGFAIATVMIVWQLLIATLQLLRTT